MLVCNTRHCHLGGRGRQIPQGSPGLTILAYVQISRQTKRLVSNETWKVPEDDNPSCPLPSTHMSLNTQIQNTVA